ncbi:putative cell wall-binding protein [Kineococcus radiotolerans]|uniref:Putative cell wall-binding protein n=1 Tax=Kineococcus radiotolerans TaxID=131568 RepID=A0A7W4TLA9_KINRA|nr:cell wall-binding repeat-containing protein [Kineococcus radiotolerans]MBB2901011.1 putative cell wall-binding protein [Kineococcus radiotolerans]
MAGVDRYDTAAKAALAGWTTGASTVIVANGEVTGIDALAASYLAGVKDAPILLTQKDSVPAQTAAAITSLNPTTVIVLGDVNSVSASTYSALVGSKTGQRIDGPNRFQTAVDVMTEAGVTPPKTVFLARGDQYGAGQVAADALAAGPAAFKNKIPVLLTNQNSLPAETLAALNTAGVTNVYVLGNVNAISDSVYTQVDGLASVTSIERIQGSDRTATAAAIANEADFGFNKTGAALANGFRIDALAAGPVAGRAGSPILLTEGTVGLGVGTDAYLKANAATLTKAWVFGDVNSVPTTITDAARTSANGGTAPTLQNIAVAPTTAASFVTADESDAATRASDDRVYTVSGLTAGTTYRISLVNADSIRTAADGSVTFLSSVDAASASGFSVDPGADIADITSVNNATPSFTGTVAEIAAARSTTVQPVNGSITFTVDGTAPGTVVPVVYVNGGAGQTSANGGPSARLETSATVAGAFAAATENYGLGGAVAYAATRAANGAFGGAVDTTATPVVASGATILSVDKTANTFTADVDTVPGSGTTTLGARSFAFDANDVYTVGGASVGLEAFKAALSSGDTIQGSYATDPGGISTFALTDRNPLTPTAATTARGTTNATSNDITVTITPNAGAGGDFDSFVVQRAVVSGGTDAATDGTVGTYATVGTPTTDADLVAANFQFVDNDVPAGIYRYRVAAVNDGDQGTYLEVTNNVASIAPSTDTTGPTAVDTRVGTNGAGSALTLNSGATFTVAFNEPVSLPASGATLRLTDADGTVVDHVVGTNLGVARNAAAVTIGGTSYPINSVLTFTVTGAGTVVTAGTGAGLSLPSTISAQSGVADVNGNAWNIAGSADATIDNE